ncbi:MAG TPA: hypothetical protein VK573_12990 [Gemmatimonadales bacterium]|nr:hypothetical protein [Gemmatimonadales bacterium]
MFQHGAAGGIARGLTHERGREDPRALHAREIAVMGGATHVPDSSLGIAAPQADNARKKPSQRSRPRETVVVDAESEIAVRAGGVRGEEAAVDVAHRLRVLGGAEGMPVLLALPRPVAQRGRAPEVRRRRTRQRDVEERVDAPQLERRGIAGGGPPDVGARLKHDGRWIARVARGQRREVRRGPLEIAAIQRVQAGA